ncbi:MAG: hypothetical protein ACK4WC_01670 [Rubrimonas sp.]
MLDDEASCSRDWRAVGTVSLHVSVVLDVIARLEAIAREDKSSAVCHEVANGADMIALRVQSLRSVVCDNRQ